mgnify:CR=1 FL=1
MIVVNTAAKTQNVAMHNSENVLFPPLQPYSSGFLKVSDKHTLYWEQCGNPDGVPIVFLHGGPGAGATTLHRRFFDPLHYRIIIFDQRGAGRSQPLGELEDNTPKHLVEDLETLRKHLKVKKWHVFGGSWGSTLALMYAIQNPEKCISLILRGIFLMENDEIEWFLIGMKRIFPERWEEFTSVVPKAKTDRKDDLLDAYIAALNAGNIEKSMNAAIAWARYEGSCATLLPAQDNSILHGQRANAQALAKIESHYFRNHTMSGRKSILKSINKIRQIPCTIVQGRYDIICPVQSAYRLSASWPEARLVIVPDGGHSALDPAIRSALVKAAQQAKYISQN